MIWINQLEKHYKGFDMNITLSVPAGRVTGIVGRNGAGKSTTIKAILGLIKPDGGEVSVFGTEISKFSPEQKQKIGVALAESGFSNWINLTAVNHIMKATFADYDEEMFLKLAEQQGLPMNKLIKDFSTGMKAKLRVLAAICHKADLLVLDEPTAGLDVIARNEILDLLRDYLKEDENRSILITSHISGDLEGLCDDIYLIHEGNVLLHEETDVLLANYGVLKVTGEMYETLDKQYLLKVKQEPFGYACLTNEKQFYAENYPGIVIEHGSIDDLILMMTGEGGRS